MTYNSAISTLPNATRTNYIFEGWYIGDTQLTTSRTWTWASNQTAVAQWTFDGYTLSSSVSGRGGTIVGASDQYVKNSSVTVTASPDEGYIFGTGGAGYERINLACPTWVLRKALERLRDALQRRG